MLFCLHTDCMTNKEDINKANLSIIFGWTRIACVQVKPEMAPLQDQVVIAEAKVYTRLKAQVNMFT